MIWKDVVRCQEEEGVLEEALLLAGDGAEHSVVDEL